ncbi:ABC-F family ATP-binding cassette domain-containing protein [Myroides pelagicus]|uniref:ABC-F family ATP-binding cassette domain-containing protein n=1 Tax=Myroides pelagicus TaxID=270914 RepID=UPI002DBB00E2|nr:ABC-F family ATP-binding cassette domain-containing protein [Myroides pelagicus]MEC4114793.1 ABC-F family ATP-binding cassette domain-containing protein [Myroides pelagicus]
MVLNISNLSYQYSDFKPVFEKLNFQINKLDKVSIVGDNGVGKSTLLRLVANELVPVSGKIQINVDLFYLQQNKIKDQNQTVVEALGVSVKLKALEAILSGSADLKNYEQLEDDWTINQRVEQALTYWGLPRFCLQSRLCELSGGEQTKVLFAKMMLSQSGLLLLDEPTNHIDQHTREKLICFINQYQEAIIVVSHDRTLLNELTITYELSQHSLERYNGNYQFYKQHKAMELASIEKKYELAEKEFKQASMQKQIAVEKQQRDLAINKKQQSKAGLPKIVINTLKNKAENSAAKKLGIHQDIVDKAREDIHMIKRQLQNQKVFDIRFACSGMHTGRVLWSLKQAQAAYRNKSVWQFPLDLDIVSGDRIHLFGANGSGKSSLLKVFMQELTLSQGILEKTKSPLTIVYLDQYYSMLEVNLSVEQQIMQYNQRGLTSKQVNNLLFQSGIQVSLWQEPVVNLSGGERLKLVLCCLTIAYQAIDVLLLDEPTNNLDITSLECLTNALIQYKGTLLVVSHDKVFVEQIGVNKTINLS